MKTESLPVPLTQEEIAERADRMATALRKITELEIEKKAKNDEIKHKKEELEKDIAVWASQVREKAENREVEIELQSNWETGQIETFRLDTGELIRTRPMTPSEKQKTFEHPAVKN